MNLLNILGENKKHLPTMLWAARLLNLIIIIVMVYFGWNVFSEDAQYTNLTSFLIWVVWWPMIIFMVLLAGRLWCSMCHLKLIADNLDGFGLKLKVPQWIIKSGTTITIIMVMAIFILHSSVESYGVNNFAYLSVIYLIILTSYTAIIALLFERHAFCKYFCPLVGFLGNYTRCSPTELRSADPSKCKTCKDKECIKHCANKLYIGTMDSQQQEGCLLCMECVKHCPKNNITFRFRNFFKGIWDSPKRSIGGTFAVIVVLGILTVELGENSEMVSQTISFVPNALTELTGVENIAGYKLWKSLWLFFVQPALILGICGAVAMIIARKDSAWNYIKIYALGLLPMLLSLHLTKHFINVNENLGYLPYVIKDPSGAVTAEAIKSGILTPPSPVLFSGSIEGFVLIIFIGLFGILGSLYITWKISKVNFADDKKQGLFSAIPFLLLIVFLGGVFALTIYNWMVAVL